MAVLLAERFAVVLGKGEATDAAPPDNAVWIIGVILYLKRMVEHHEASEGVGRKNDVCKQRYFLTPHPGSLGPLESVFLYGLGGEGTVAGMTQVGICHLFRYSNLAYFMVYVQSLSCLSFGAVDVPCSPRACSSTCDP